ncbi:phage repressor [Marinilabilia salmonicolor]|uniref:phage repressor n=1 Tax=Marinilabilia salmonicolor TaxID=989 RepID=UPI00029AAD81|nr:phage repressor [Marinilabilia salmonicolor]
MSVKERLKTFIRYRGVGERQFCRTIGVSESFVSAMRKSLQPDKITSILHQYPELNINWLLTGEGTMVQKSHARLKEAKTTIHVLNNLIDSREERIHILEEENTALKSEIDSLHKQLILYKERHDSGNSSGKAESS